MFFGEKLSLALILSNFLINSVPKGIPENVSQTQKGSYQATY